MDELVQSIRAEQWTLFARFLWLLELNIRAISCRHEYNKGLNCAVFVCYGVCVCVYLSVRGSV